jgi:hypothetical protein
MENPYQPPSQMQEVSLPRFAWRRVVVWSLLIVIAANIVGLISGLTMTRWEVYGSTIEQAVENARLVRRIGYGVVGALLYWRFARPLQTRLLHVMAAFATVQFFDIAVSFFIFHAPASELVDGWAVVRSAAAAAVGLGLARLGSNNSFKVTPGGAPRFNR